MKLSSTISSKGQVTIPQEIRVRLGLDTGDEVEFVVEDGRTVLRPVRGPASPFDKYKGALGAFPGGINEINSWVRELRDEDKESSARPRRRARK